MPGTVAGIPDDPSHGPLDDGRERVAYMQACFRGYDDWSSDITDAFAPWRELIARLDAEEPEAVLIWSGDNVSEAIFLAMACWWLRQRREPVLRVAMPGQDGRHHVATYAPAELTELYRTRRELKEAERVALSEDFVRIRDENGFLRRWVNGQIVGVPADRYDRLLLNACSSNWLPAPRVVGAAMGRCDRHNLMSDLFFASRLQALIEAGRIEAEGVRDRLRDYAVRLAAT
jgi:hypothetical protein